MMDWLRRLRKSNRGSSLVVTIVAISFVAILGTAIMSATMANFSTKMMNYRSQKTFYSAESALEEVYSGVSKESFEKLNTAYLETVTILANYTSAGDPNAEANANMRNNYLNAVRNMIVSKNGASGDPFDASNTEREGLKSWMNGFITHNNSDPSATKYAYVDEIGEVKNMYEADGTTLAGYELDDVSVVFVSTVDDYYSSVTVDMKIGYPDVSFNFIDNRNHLNTYLDYAIIGMQGVDVNANDVVSGAGVYAGSPGGAVANGGLTIRDNGMLTLSDSSLLVTCTNVNINDRAKLSVGENSKVWATNINVNDGSILDTSATSTLYLADDLNLQGTVAGGTGASASLSGRYYGFGYQADPERAAINKYAYKTYSSAVVVNGSKTKLDMSGLTTLLLSGRAYIKVGNGVTKGYMTGDSDGLKQIQEIYLVPTAYINKDYSNPMISSPGVATDAFSAVNYRGLRSNPLYKDYVDKDEPVIAIYETVDGVQSAYYYVNFKDNASRTGFVAQILDSANAEYDGWSELNSIAKKAVESLLESTLPSGSVVTGGNLFSVAGETLSVTGSSLAAEGTGAWDSMINRCDDKAHRYKVLDQFLYDIGSDDADNPGQSGTNVDSGQTISIPQLNADGSNGISELHPINDTRSYYEYVIDMDKWNQIDSILADYTLWDGRCYVNNSVPAPGGAAGTAVLVKGTESVKLTDLGVTKGVVLANDAEIIVDQNFEGLVISNNKVTMMDNVTVKANRQITENTIKYDSVLNQFFVAYQGANLSGLTAADVSNSDLLVYDNWRKNYDK